MNGRSGKFDVRGGTQILTFRIADRQRGVVRALVSLGWDSAELAKFVGGVRVPVTAHRGAAERAGRLHIQVGYGVGRPR